MTMRGASAGSDNHSVPLALPGEGAPFGARGAIRGSNDPPRFNLIFMKRVQTDRIMRAWFLWLGLSLTWLGVAAAQPATTPPPAPKLVVAVVIDQFRYDYLTRYRSEYTGGLNRLLTKGAVFTNANYEQAPTLTAVGHSIFLSGAFPSVSGIIGNEWFDRASGKTVTSVTDDSVKLLGGSSEG